MLRETVLMNLLHRKSVQVPVAQSGLHALLSHELARAREKLRRIPPAWFSCDATSPGRLRFFQSIIANRPQEFHDELSMEFGDSPPKS
jgi:hypothetical protein